MRWSLKQVYKDMEVCQLSKNRQIWSKLNFSKSYY